MVVCQSVLLPLRKLIEHSVLWGRKKAKGVVRLIHLLPMQALPLHLSLLHSQYLLSACLRPHTRDAGQTLPHCTELTPGRERQTDYYKYTVTRCDRCCEGSMQGAVAKNNARVLVHLSGDLTGTEGRSRERGWAVAQLEWGRCEDGHCDLSERT